MSVLSYLKLSRLQTANICEVQDHDARRHSAGKGLGPIDDTSVGRALRGILTGHKPVPEHRTGFLM